MMDIGTLVRRSMHASAQDDSGTIDELVRPGILNTGDRPGRKDRKRASKPARPRVRRG